MDSRTDEDKINIFIKEATNLQNEPFVTKTMGSIKITQNFDSETKRYNETFEKFEYNDFVALLLNFRKFISNNEPVFINYIFKILEKTITNEEMKDFARKARKRINDFSQHQIALSIGGKKFTYEEIKDLYINGYYFHLDQKHSDFLNQLPSDTFSRLRWFFFDYVSEYIGLIIWLYGLITYCLENNLIDYSKNN